MTPWDGSEDAHAGTAVHLHGPAREEIALEDESHRLPDLFRPAEPPERNPGLQAGEGLCGKTFQEPGLRDAGSDPADADTVAGQLQRPGTGAGIEARFRSGIIRLSRIARPGDRGQIDDHGITRAG